ncbi:MAG: GYD domain-containing protein [Hyphomicrobiales bacterium]|nr:GYD domain-containing protein [Hyphomicrobiales bacterium]
MAKYIALVNWTDQGIKGVKESPKRVDAARGLAKKLGCEMKDLYMTIGPYDMVAMLEAPDDEAAAKFALTLGSAGNVRTTTLKAFSEDSFRKIVAAL